MDFEELLIKLYPINDKNNKLKKFIQNNLKSQLIVLYIQELSVYMIAATKVSGTTILEKILYEYGNDDLDEMFNKEKEDIIKHDIYFELKEDEEEPGYFYLKANGEVIGVIQEDLQLFKQLQDFILY
ncbi:MAG: hypothetical protein ACRDD7_03315 [Peptostreptococcaceae bacterium]